MKAFLIAAAAFGLAATAAAPAQMADHSRTTTVEQTTQGGGLRRGETTRVTERTVTHRDSGWHRGWHRGLTQRKVCVTRWQNHKRVRHCAWKRVRR